MAIKPGTVIFWTENCPEGRAEARAWLKAQGYTPDEVVLTQVRDEIVATARVSLGSKKKPPEPKSGGS